MATDLETAAQSLLITEAEPAPAESEEVETATDEAEAVEPEQTETEEAEAPEGEEAETEQDAPEAADEEGQEEAAPELFTVKVDGKDVSVTLEDLKRDYSGQAYIQKGMQEAAQARKQAAELFQALQSEQAKFLEAVQQVQQQGYIAPPKAPDMALMKTDPIGYMEADAVYRQEQAAYQAQQSQLANVAKQRDAMQKAAQAQYLAEQQRILAAQMPEFVDPTKGPEIQRKIRQAGVEDYGFTDDELSAVTDARHVKVLHDAMKWRELQKTKAQAVKPAPKALKPQAKVAQPPQLARANQIKQAKKTGNLRDFAATLLVPKG